MSIIDGMGKPCKAWPKSVKGVTVGRLKEMLEAYPNDMMIARFAHASSDNPPSLFTLGYLEVKTDKVYNFTTLRETTQQYLAFFFNTLL